MSVVLFMKTGNTWKRIADKSKSVGTKVDEILSLELRQALNTLLVRQGEVAAIANATPSVLRNLLVDIDILNRMSNHLDNFESNLESKINALSEDYRSPESIQEQINECKKRIEDYTASIEKRKDEISSTEQLLKDIPNSESLKKVSGISDEIEGESRELENRQKDLNDDLSRAGLLEAEEVIVDARLDSLEREKDRVELERESLLGEIQTIDQQIGQIRGTNSDLEEKITTLTKIRSEEESIICPTCSKPLSPKERDSLVSEYKKSIKTGAAEIKVLDHARSEHSTNIRKIESRVKEIDRISEAAKAVQSTKKKVDAVQQRITKSQDELSKILGTIGISNIDTLKKISLRYIE